MEHFYDTIDGWAIGIPRIYKDIVNKSKDGAHFVEIGSWLGKSSASMCVEIINSGKNIKFDCIDIWDVGTWSSKTVEGMSADDLYNKFIKNMEPVKDTFTAIREDSTKAADLYTDNSLDFIFLDADHSYESVKRDITAWLPKVKSGGILAGDDYHPNFPGTMAAVNETLGRLITSGPLIPSGLHMRSDRFFWYIKP